MEVVSEGVRHACVEAGVSDPALVRLLELKRGTETFKEIVTTGWIQPGDEPEALPLSRATVRDFQRLLDMAHREHILQAVELKRARQTVLVSTRAVVSAVGENVVTVKFTDTNLSRLVTGATVRITISAEPCVEKGG